jgi:hypothetical protein
MLNNRPYDQKLCPLCRAEWLPEEYIIDYGPAAHHIGYGIDLGSPVEGNLEYGRWIRRKHPRTYGGLRY